MGAPITLETEAMRAVIDTDAGAHLCELSLRTPGGWRDIIVPGSGNGCGAFPMVPFSGRILDGRASNGGRDWQAPPHPTAGPNAMHGDGWNRRWGVLEQRRDSASLSLDYPTDCWPFDHRVKLTMACTGDRFRFSLDVSGGDGLPFGLGWHPYFPYAAGARLCLEFDRARQLQNYRFVDIAPATGTGVDLTPGLRTREFRVKGRSALVKWPGQMHQLRMDWTGVSHVVVYLPQSGEGFAIEPANHAVGHFEASQDTARAAMPRLARQLCLSLRLQDAQP